MKRNFAYVGVAVLLFSIVFPVYAQPVADGLGLPDTLSVLSAYRQYRNVGALPIQVPTVVEMPLGSEFLERFDFAVLDQTSDSFEPYYFKQETYANQIPFSITSNAAANGSRFMADGDVRTYAEFYLPDLSDFMSGTANIQISSNQPITSSAITALLDNNVALPTLVSIRAVVDGQIRTVVSSKRMDGQTIRFPQTTSSNWSIAFTFTQPLRITELKLQQDTATRSSVRSIRFLAQPSHSYRIYFDSDRFARAQVGEAANLSIAKDVLVISMTSAQANPAYRIADVDADGVPDVFDNCVQTSNPGQEDVNQNGRGDVCDDFDQDGLANDRDNCPNNPNRDQADVDSDGIGNVCDGEESRITEKYAWLPWVGIGFAGLVVVVLLFLTARSKPPESSREDGDIPLETPQP